MTETKEWTRRVQVCVRAYACVHVCVCVRAYVRVCAQVCACMCACVAPPPPLSFLSLSPVHCGSASSFSGSSRAALVWWYVGVASFPRCVGSVRSPLRGVVLAAWGGLRCSVAL